jgi:hypothetical protein
LRVFIFEKPKKKYIKKVIVVELRVGRTLVIQPASLPACWLGRTHSQPNKHSQPNPETVGGSGWLARE